MPRAGRSVISNMAEAPTKMRPEKRPLDLVPWEAARNLLLDNFRTKYFRDKKHPRISLTC